MSKLDRSQQYPNSTFLDNTIGRNPWFARAHPDYDLAVNVDTSAVRQQRLIVRGLGVDRNIPVSQVCNANGVKDNAAYDLQETLGGELGYLPMQGDFGLDGYCRTNETEIACRDRLGDRLRNPFRQAPISDDSPVSVIDPTDSLKESAPSNLAGVGQQDISEGEMQTTFEPSIGGICFGDGSPCNEEVGSCW